MVRPWWIAPRQRPARRRRGSTPCGTSACCSSSATSCCSPTPWHGPVRAGARSAQGQAPASASACAALPTAGPPPLRRPWLPPRAGGGGGLGSPLPPDFLAAWLAFLGHLHRIKCSPTQLDAMGVKASAGRRRCCRCQRRGSAATISSTALHGRLPCEPRRGWWDWLVEAVSALALARLSFCSSKQTAWPPSMGRAGTTTASQAAREEAESTWHGGDGRRGQAAMRWRGRAGLTGSASCCCHA